MPHACMDLIVNCFLASENNFVGLVYICMYVITCAVCAGVAHPGIGVPSCNMYFK